MIYLFTGIPGAGKTLNAIKFVLEDERFKNRKIYAHNINGLTIDDWEQIDKQQATEWYDLPSGSVVIIDECQDVWRPLKTGSTVPESIQRLEKHRHQGIDLILTCQYPRQIHIGVRRMVTNHYHLFRPFGMNTISQLAWEKCEDAPDDYHAKQKAQKTRINLDKNIYDKYKSAEVHTVKRSIPKKLYLLIFFLTVFIISVFFLVYKLTSLATTETEQTQELDQPKRKYQHQQSYDTTDNKYYKTQYVTNHTNTIPNDDRSKPIYKELLKPQSIPREQCLTNETRTRCTCYSQQATKMQADLQTCLYYIDNGYSFDYTRKDPSRDKTKQVDQRKKTNGGKTAHDARLPRFTVIPNTGRPDFPNYRNSNFPIIDN